MCRFCSNNGRAVAPKRNTSVVVGDGGNLAPNSRSDCVLGNVGRAVALRGAAGGVHKESNGEDLGWGTSPPVGASSPLDGDDKDTIIGMTATTR